MLVGSCTISHESLELGILQPTLMEDLVEIISKQFLWLQHPQIAYHNGKGPNKVELQLHQAQRIGDPEMIVESMSLILELWIL